MFIVSAAAPSLVSKGKYLLPGQPGLISTEALKKSELKFVCITIDDVPEAVYTKQMLEVLLKHKARATFFVNGARVKAFPETAKMIAAAGHEIANHTWSHPRMTKLSSSEAKAELQKTNEIVKKLCDVTPKFYRPPFGDNDARITNLAGESGLITVLWSIDTQDWKKPGVDKINAAVSGSLHNGAVILMHGTNDQSPLALDKILSDLSAKGYVTVTMSEWYRLLGGKISFDPGRSGENEKLIERLYEQMDVEDVSGEHFKILVPKLGTGDLRLSELQIETADASLSIYSNFKFVDGEEIPAAYSGLLRPPPPNFFRLPHNTFEIRPDGRNFALTLTDSPLPEFNPHYYPRPALVMLARAKDFPAINPSRLDALYKSAGFEKLVILKENPEDSDPDLSGLTQGISAQVLSNKMNFPVASIETGEGLVRKYIDLLRQKRTAVTMLVTPDTFLDDDDVANELRRFVQFRAISGVYTYDPADDIRTRWAMPEDVEISRFTANNRIILMLFSRTGESFELAATKNDEHLEIAVLDNPRQPKFLRIAAGTRISIGAEPVYLIYRWGDAASETHEGPG